MVETVRPNFTQFSPRESGLVAPAERRILTNEELAGMFGINYRNLIERKAVELGIHDRLNFFDQPHPHEGSEAIYIVEQYVGDNWVLVPILRPNMRTSRHHHESPMGQERYFHIAGESFINVGGNQLALNHKQDIIAVPLNVIHQVTTEDKPALTMIVMEKARLVAPGKLHIRDNA